MTHFVPPVAGSLRRSLRALGCGGPATQLLACRARRTRWPWLESSPPRLAELAIRSPGDPAALQ